MLHDQLIAKARERLARRALPVDVQFWNGERHSAPDGALLRLAIHTPRGLRAFAYPTLGGLARAYVEGDFDIEGRTRDILLIGERLCDADTALGSWGSSALSWLRHSRPAERKNIGFHYDVSNDFFGLWLDARRVYSCAYFLGDSETLEQAQENKLDLICRKLMLHPGERLLDIGCGWGALVIWAAQRYGARCVGITLSQDQHDHVAGEVRRLGLQDRVEVRLQNYRDLPEDETYDKIASVGMFEHVGRSLLDGYFARLRTLLRPGGLVLNHGITAGGLKTAGLRSGIADFIENYVFPGGDLEHVSRVMESLSKAGLESVDVESLRPHYARTLWHWVDRLEEKAEQARALVGDSRYRVWRIYMAGSAHAFSRGWISVYQILAGRPFADGGLGYPFTRLHLGVGLGTRTPATA